MSTVSTHILDTALGSPAGGIPVALESKGSILVSGRTDTDGRLRLARPLGTGDYSLKFAVGEYFAKTNRESFYNDIVIHFRIGSDSEHYHVPLLLSPFGYATYRGS